MKFNLVLPLVILLTFALGCNLLNQKEQPKPENPKPTVEKTVETTKPTETVKPVETQGNVPTSANFLHLASGAYFVKQPKSERAFDNQPINLIFDGMNWRSEESALNDNVFVIETPGETTLKTVAFDLKHPFATPDENAKDILFEASNVSADSGYQTILETSLKQDVKMPSFPVTAEIPARWFRLTVKNNHGSANATAISQIFGYGTQKTADVPQDLSGTYRKVDTETGKVGTKANRYDIFLKQDGTSVLGCGNDVGTFAGGLEGTVAKVNWKNEELGENSGLMTFTRNKRFVFWRLKDEGFWALDEYEQVDTKLGECPDIPDFKGKDTAKSQLAKELEKDGRAVIYGINFDFNSDKLRDESKIVLNQIVTVLKEKPDWKMSIEGHTDNIGGEVFNQTLSEKRAKSVVDYLTAAGIDAARLSSSGKGLSSPIEKNDTEFGRAKNRRVELVKQ
jgi:OmpA-OmpF porin, OOP family